MSFLNTAAARNEEGDYIMDLDENKSIGIGCAFMQYTHNIYIHAVIIYYTTHKKFEDDIPTKMLTHTHKHTHTDRHTNRQTLYASLRVTQRKEEEEEKKETKMRGALLDSACGCCKNRYLVQSKTSCAVEERGQAKQHRARNPFP